MKKVSGLSIFFLTSLTLFLNCIDAFDNPNCQFTIIVTTINQRPDTVRVDIVLHDITTIEPNSDNVYIGHHEYQGREVCLSPAELILCHNTYIKSLSTLKFDSLIQTDTIDPWEFSYEIGETNILEEVEVLIR